MIRMTTLHLERARDDFERRRPIDVNAVEAAARDLLTTLGVDLDEETLQETPGRMARAYIELLTPEPFTATTFPNDGEYNELVLERSIPFASLCEHHVLPFVGVAHVGYVPGQRIIGLSKLGRAVEHLARGLQVQERLTVDIADWLEDTVAPEGVGVMLEAEHLCVSMRGARTTGSRTVTSRLTGKLRDEPAMRAEFFARCAGQ
jgi:GTP cyclohydrolase I